MENLQLPEIRSNDSLGSESCKEQLYSRSPAAELSEAITGQSDLRGNELNLSQQPSFSLRPHKVV